MFKIQLGRYFVLPSVADGFRYQRGFSVLKIVPWTLNNFLTLKVIRPKPSNLEKSGMLKKSNRSFKMINISLILFLASVE